MSRSKRRQGGRRAASQPSGRRPKSRLPIVPVVALLVAAGLGLWWWRQHSTSRGKPAAAAFDPRKAYREAMVLGQQKLFVESLPALRSSQLRWTRALAISARFRFMLAVSKR